VRRTEHRRILAIRKSDNDIVADDCRVLRVFNAKNLAAAAMNRERPERDAFQISSNLLKHSLTLASALGGGNAFRGSSLF